jgi:hypothetical protein
MQNDGIEIGKYKFHCPMTAVIKSVWDPTVFLGVVFSFVINFTFYYTHRYPEKYMHKNYVHM